jgi:hypothetical protein
MKACSRSLAIALTTGLLAGCASGQPHEPVITLGSGVTVTLPSGAPDVTARRVTVTLHSRLAELLAPPQHLMAAGRLPGRAVLTFHVGHVRGRPFLAWLDRGQWTPVRSMYHAQAGTVSAAVPRLSTWAPFTWATDQIRAWVTSALRDIFGLGRSWAIRLWTARRRGCSRCALMFVLITVFGCRPGMVAAGPG